jgi:glycosyltransferase involved in cell wall biosynthesis
MLGRYRAALRRFRPDHIIGFHPLANVLGALGARLLGAVFTGTQRNPAQSQRPSLFALDALLGSTPLYRHNVCVSQAVVRSFARHPAGYRRKLSVIYDGLRPLARPDQSMAEARRQLGLPASAFIAGSLGRLHSQKNLGFLIDVLARADAVHLAVAGEGPEESMLREKAAVAGVADRVSFVGNLDGSEVSRFYTAIDVFALPSLYEGFGMTMLEAMSFGRPVIASDLPVLREVAGDAAAFCPLEPERWAAALRQLRPPSPMWAEKSGLSRAQADRYTLSANIANYLSLLAPEGGR